MVMTVSVMTARKIFHSGEKTDKQAYDKGIDWRSDIAVCIQEPD